MSDAALHASADQLGEDALRENIRHRVEAAGTSFYWAMRLLPRDRRNAMYAVYAFCREVDDIADSVGPVGHKLSALAGTDGVVHKGIVPAPIFTKWRLDRLDIDVLRRHP